jgi:two-component system sensor histidine kinase AtoS
MAESSGRAPLPLSEPASQWMGPHVMDLLERAGYGLVFINEEGLLLFCNVTARKSLGWQHRLLIGSRLEELDLPDVAGLDLSQMLKQQLSAVRTQVSLKNGSEQEWVVAPVRFGPLQERGLLLLLRPLRDRLEILASCGERVAAISHNLNNQLARARAWAAVLTQEIGSLAGCREAVEELGDSLRMFQEQIEEILHPLRGASSEPIDLVPLVESAWATACSSLGDVWACQLRLESYGDALSVKAVEEKLASVLHNLFRNAMEASPSGWVHCCVEQEGSEVIVHIADGGEGVNEQMLLQPQTTKEHGHGLGLADVQRTVLQLGGSLDIHAIEDGRRSLVIRLPAA